MAAEPECPVAAAAMAGPGLAARAWRAPLWAHAALLALLLVALYPLMSPGGSFTSDEGAYATEAQALAHGSWTYDYRAARYDPGGSAFPIVLSERGPSGFYTYVKHPAVPLLLRAGQVLGGDVLGLHLLGLLGAVGAAVAAWLLAGEIDPRLRRPAFWLAVTGPVLVNGYLIWAHAASAALAGLALVCAARVVRNGVTWPSALALGATLSAGVLLRSEALLFAGALAVVLAAARLRQAGVRSALAASAIAAGPAAITSVVEKRCIERIVGGVYGDIHVRAGTGSSSFLGGRLSGAWHELVQAHYIDSAAGLPVLLVLAVVAGGGWMALHRWGPGSRRALLTVAGLSAALVVLRMATHPHDPVTGLLAAWPPAVLGVLLVRWRGAGPVVTLLGGTAALFGAAVLGSQYPEGGGVEWGGRFLSPALVPLAVLAVAGLARALSAVPAADRRLATSVVVWLAVTTALFALVTSGALRAREDAIVTAVARHPSPVMVTTRPALPRLAWRADDRLTWMLTDPAGLTGLLRALRAQGVPQVTVLADADVPLAALAAYPYVEEPQEPSLAGDGLRLAISRDR